MVFRFISLLLTLASLALEGSGDTDKVGIAEENILICATHTHSGPEVFTRSKFESARKAGTPGIDEAYLQTLVRKIAGSVVIAYRSKQEVKIGAAVGRLGEMVFNRRTIKPDGSALMTWRVTAEVAATRKIETGGDGPTTVSFTLDSNEPDLTFGPVDPEVWVLRVEDANDNIVGSIVNYACHPVCVYPHLPTSISADFPGDATEFVERGEGGVCLFALGAAGDIVPYQRGVKAHRQIGRAIGGQAVVNLQFVETSGDVILRAIKKEIKFPTRRAASAEAAVMNCRLVTLFSFIFSPFHYSCIPSVILFHYTSLPRFSFIFNSSEST